MEISAMAIMVLNIFKFISFVHKYGKVYKNQEEFIYRFGVFRASLTNLSLLKSSGNTTHGVTKFSDMTVEEFKAKLTLKVDAKYCQPTELKFLKDIKTADSLDYRALGKVSPIKDQAQCGSCWAFSTTGFMESQLLMANKTAETFSEQQLVDCDQQYDQGCNGGLQQYAMNYISEKGIMDDSYYKYIGVRSFCLYKAEEAKTKVTNVKCHENSKVADIKQYLNEVGPMAIALDATDFQYYDSGVLDCANSNLDHAVLLVGYGTEAGKDYWIVKNSWGLNWGEEGYVRINQDAAKNCAIGVYLVSAEIIN